MKYIFKNEKGEEIEAAPERWAWGVIYKDGREFKQFGDDGIFHRFAEIKQDEVELFVMYKMDDIAKRVDLIPDGGQIFHFYRNTVLNFGTKEEVRSRVFVFGFKKEKTAIYHYIFPDDRMVTAPGDIVKIS